MANVEFSNYEMHKQLYAAMAAPSEKTIGEQFVSIGAWFSTHPASNYYTLMCREIYDFTTFHFKNMNYDAGMKEVKKTLESRGKVIDISYSQNNDAYECWVKCNDGEIRMYMLFDSDFMVVEVE